MYLTVNNTSVCKYWKILFYPPNTDTGTFHRGSTDIDTDAQYPKFNTNMLVFPVFFSIIILWLCKFNNYVPFISLETSIVRLRRLDKNN